VVQAQQERARWRSWGLPTGRWTAPVATPWKTRPYNKAAGGWTMRRYCRWQRSSLR